MAEQIADGEDAQMIEFKNIKKHFLTKKNSVHALNDVSFQIDDGEIFGIVGFSGAGKSTLVRMINLSARFSVCIR